MPVPQKFEEAPRERAVRMDRDRLEQHGEGDRCTDRCI
jgi:hypothetical protein